MPINAAPRAAHGFAHGLEQAHGFAVGQVASLELLGCTPIAACRMREVPDALSIEAGSFVDVRVRGDSQSAFYSFQNPGLTQLSVVMLTPSGSYETNFSDNVWPSSSPLQ